MTASRLDDSAPQARFVFLGTILRLNASTETAIPHTDRTAVVRVDDVLRAPLALGEQTDREITVQLSEDKPSSEGDQAVFFTDPWLYGEGLAVVEVERRHARETTSVRQQLQANDGTNGDDALKRRLEVAELVVVATVTNTRPLTPGRPPIVTEHDPEWWEAVVAVQSVLKGTWQAPTLTVLFAASMDVLWFQAPKLRVRQEAILLLHHEQAPNLPQEAYALLDPLDALPLDQLDHVQRLLGG